MDKGLWIALIAVAVGTFLMRTLPLVYMQRHLQRSDKDTAENMPAWLGVLGPSMIAAMFGTSLVPHTSNTASWSATALGLIATFLTWKQTKSLGWPIIAGVAAYGIVKTLVTATT
ncbi:AzlD domain-containing protein [Luteolibacter soli]|uniref:AzlD domain-containing protein n=1 Tax=Luteolibacter soli TaxID=3135280 RepID=A0ABU9AU94_9BACT